MNIVIIADWLQWHDTIISKTCTASQLSVGMHLTIEGPLHDGDVLPDALIPLCLHLHSNCA